MPTKSVAELLRQFESSWPEPAPSGLWVDGDLTWRWTAAPAETAGCPKCEASLGADVAESGELRCEACGDITLARAIPAAFARQVQSAALLIGGATALERPPVAAKLIALQCPQCGAGLTVGEGAPRITTCRTCDSQVHIPDAVWRQLHPPHRVVPWTVRFDGVNAAVAERERAAARSTMELGDEQRKKVAARIQPRPVATHVVPAPAPGRPQPARDATLAPAAWRSSAVASGLMLLSVIAYALGGASRWPVAVPSLFTATAAAFVLAWFVGATSIARQLGAPLRGSLLSSGVLVVGACVPVLGVAVGWFLVLLVRDGREPWPVEFERPEEDARLPERAGWPIGLLLLTTGLYTTVVTATVFDKSIGELADAMADKD